MKNPFQLADDFLIRSLGLFDKLARSFTSPPSTNEVNMNYLLRNMYVFNKCG